MGCRVKGFRVWGSSNHQSNWTEVRELAQSSPSYSQCVLQRCHRAGGPWATSKAQRQDH